MAQLLRRYHDAVAGFDPGPHSWPASPPAPFDGALVSHNDPNLDNVVFRDHRAVAFNDFDLASPGCAVWDVAAAARLWSPLVADGDIGDSRRGRSLPRFKTFFDSYGAEHLNAEALVEAVLLNHDWLYSIIRSGAEHGNPGFQDYWHHAAERVDRTRQWYRTNRRMLLDALDGRGHHAR